MPGGSLNYAYHKIDTVIEDIESYSKEWGEIKVKGNELNEKEKKQLLAAVKKLSADLKSISERTKDFEWWLSANIGDRDYLNKITGK